MFARSILYKSCDSNRPKRVKVVKISLITLFIDRLCIKVWRKVLIFVASISIPKIPVYLIKACFSIFLHKSIVSKIKSGITFLYIVVCKKAYINITIVILLLLIMYILYNVQYGTFFQTIWDWVYKYNLF